MRADVWSVDRVRIPPDPDFGGHWDRRDRAHDRSRHSRQSRAILQEGRAAILRHDFVHRAAEIQIDKIRAHPIHDVFRRFRHVLRISAKELDPDRPLAFVEIEVFARALVPPEHAFGGDKFRHEDIRAALLAELAENLVRDPRHRREIKWKTGG